MGIDAKDVCVIVWKVIRFSTNTTCRYVKRYPFAAGVSAFVIFLYSFLPWVLYFMLCSSPLIACASFYLRNHLSSKMDEEEKRRGRTEKAELKHQRSVRRNARREVEEVGKDWDSSQASEDERGKVILTTLYGELLPETITPDVETFKRDREESFVERLTSGRDGETEVECSSSEEEKERNKVIVAWTEDDQKNLMDLGTSEIERNKRLENLITRRRSRRFFLSLMDMEVPRICIGRNYYGLDKEGVVMPGSAPSVMLPRRNPFDLPYDPHEEKPNLTGDSFQQEFSDANPKDVFFCRHESFHHRIFSSGSQNDSKLDPLWRKTVDASNDQLPQMKESETDSIRNNDDSDSSGGSSSLANARQRYMEHFGYSIKRSHVTTHSVDSDLQVEVSELGSPPSSVDGNDEERSLFINDSSEVLPVGKFYQDLNETKSLASPQVEEARTLTLEPMVPQPDDELTERAEDLKKLPENSADEIKMSYDSDEAEPSERTNQEPCVRNDQVEMQQLEEAEASDVIHQDSDTSPTSVLQDMLPLSHTHSEDLDHTSDGLDPPAESSSNQSNEHSNPTETTVEEKQEGSEEPLINEESKSAEDLS